MGYTLSKIFRTKMFSILFLGPDYAGKTTLLYKIKNKDTVKRLPKIGFSVETVEYNNLQFTAWDVGG